jgi:hypothetical protein
MVIPKVIKVGAQRMRVMVQPVVKLDEEICLGVSQICVGRIEIASTFKGEDVPEDSMADTFLHEVIHATNATYGLDLSETQVMGLAGGLLQVIRDNKLDFRK